MMELLLLTSTFTYLILLYLWVKRNYRTKLLQANSHSKGVISPAKPFALLMITLSLAMLLYGVWDVVFNDGFVFFGFCVLFISGLISGFFATMLSGRHDVKWGSHGLDGPSSAYGLTPSWKMRRITWSEMVKVGRTLTGYNYVEGEGGGRIFWSYLYPKRAMLEENILQAIKRNAKPKS